ncbi:MAG: type II secretion system protein, partial [Clostridia bacterium]
MQKLKPKNLKKEQGITLIALVVTIVVLLILAAVSLNLVLGNNGLITKSKDAKDQTEMAQIKD